MTTPNSGAGSRRGSGGGGTRTPGRGAGGSGDGSQRGSPGLSATASCLRWAECPQNLLDDPEGVLLLKQFMEDMNPSHARAFDFYFAVKGLKSGCQQPQQHQLIRLINRKYVSRDDCVPISAAVRAAIQARVRAGDTDPCLFDPALDEVVHFLTDTVYPAFLKSDLYINYLACVGSGATWQPCLAGVELATNNSTAAGASCSPAVHTPRSLPTVHEDRELQQQLTAAVAAAAGSRAGSVPRSRSSPAPATTGAAAATAARPVLDLTIKNLYATRFQRGRASLPEFAGGPQTGAVCYSMSQAALPYHTSYAPGSKQDSELQSLSSDALTDDTLSQADTASSFEQHQHSRRSHRRAIRRSADINKEDPRAAIIPRPATAALATEAMAAATAAGRPVGCDATNNPAEFARLLIEKLQAHQRDVGRTERLHEAIGRPERPTGAGLLNSDWAQRLLARNSESHNPEQILDNHLETVFDRAAGGAQQVSSSRPDTEHVHHYHYHHHYGGADGAGSSGGIAGACRQSKSTSSLADSGVGTVSSRGRSGRQSSQQHRQQPPSASPGAQISFPMAPPQSLQLQPNPPIPTSLSMPASASLQKPQPPPVSQRQLNLHVAQQAASASIAAGPRQPFACDPNMSLVDKPLTDNVIVEARRRLEEMSLSAAEESTGAQQPHLTIGYFLFGESVPFRCTWSGREITLGEFKQLIAKKGNFRYFFKKRSDEFVVGGAVHEEVTDDSEVLPLWDGKVVGKVEKVE